MGYIDETLRQAIMDEVISPNIKDITIQAMLTIAQEYKEDEASLDEFRKQFVNTVMDISEPLITKMIEAYLKIYNMSVASCHYQNRRDIEFLKTMMFNSRPMVVDGDLLHHSSAGMQAEYKDYLIRYNEANGALHTSLFPKGEPEGYISIRAPVDLTEKTKPKPDSEEQA